MDRHGIFDLDLVGDRRLGIADQRHIGRGAAHVVGDEIPDAGAPARIGGRDDAGGRARHDGLGGLASDEARRDHAAIAVHHQDIVAVTALGELVGQPLDITGKQGLDGSVDRRRHAALEFTAFGKQRVAERDVAVRPDPGGDLAGALLMDRIGVGVQEMDDEGLAALVDQVSERGAQGFLVERQQHIAAGIEALGHFQTQVARNDRPELALHAVGVRAGAAPEFQNVAEATRGDQARAAQIAFENGIRRGRRAVDDEIDGRSVGFCGIKRIEYALRLVVDGGRRLGETHTAGPGIEENEIGEGAADIDASDLRLVETGTGEILR
ncbi:hypothetical protein COL154_014178, partial [Colletotrichum chrysophilum]